MTFVNKYLSIYVSDIKSLSVIAISLNEVPIILRVFCIYPWHFDWQVDIGDGPSSWRNISSYA